MLTEMINGVEVLPSYCRARVLILGVGNVLFGDDGFGPRVAEVLLQRYIIPEDMYVMDVGTGVRKLLFTLILSEVKPQEIIIVDAVDWGNEIGKVGEISVTEIPITKMDDFSLHQAPTSNLLSELQKDYGVNVTVIVCDVGKIPQIIAPGLSTKIEQAVAIVVESLAERFSIDRA